MQRREWKHNTLYYFCEEKHLKKNYFMLYKLGSHSMLPK